MPKTYISILGDMWDGIALKTIGSESYTDALIQANLQYKSLYIFPAGIVLTIPAVVIKRPSTLPPWKRKGQT